MTQPPLPLGAVIEPITLATTLRDAWLSRRAVCVQLTDCLIPFVVGRVDHVAVTGTWLTIDGWHVPIDRVCGVHDADPVDIGTYAHLMHDLRMRVGKENS